MVDRRACHILCVDVCWLSLCSHCSHCKLDLLLARTNLWSRISWVRYNSYVKHLDAQRFLISVVLSHSTTTERRVPMSSVRRLCTPLASIAVTTKSLNSTSDAESISDSFKVWFVNTWPHVVKFCAIRSCVLSSSVRVHNVISIPDA